MLVSDRNVRTIQIAEDGDYEDIEQNLGPVVYGNRNSVYTIYEDLIPTETNQNTLLNPTSSHDQSTYYLEMNRNKLEESESIEEPEVKPSKFQRLRKTSVMVKRQLSKSS